MTAAQRRRQLFRVRQAARRAPGPLDSAAPPAAPFTPETSGSGDATTRGDTAPPESKGMTPVPVDAPDHVAVVADPRVWSVKCSHCGVLHALYVITIQRDPGVVQRCVEEHRWCTERAA